jgi:hypothetical protein
MAKQTIGVGSAPNDNTGDFIRDAFIKVNSNFDELYTDDAGDVGSITATAPIARDSATGAVTISLNDLGVTSGKLAADSVITAKILNNNVTQAKLENRYKEVVTSTATGSQNLDASAAATFRLTGNVGTATLTIQNMKKGQVIDILLEGTLSSAVITLAADFTTETFNKVGATNFDQSAKNLIQVVCLDDTDGGAFLNYSVAPLVLNDPTPAD